MALKFSIPILALALVIAVMVFTPNHILAQHALQDGSAYTQMWDDSQSYQGGDANQHNSSYIEDGQRSYHGHGGGGWHGSRGRGRH